MVAAFVIKREGLTQRVFHEKELPLQTDERFRFISEATVA